MPWISLWALLIVVGLSCQSAALSVSRDPVRDILGDRFRCNDRSWVRLCLNVLKTDCSLSIVPGRGLPREPEDKLVPVHGDEARIVKGFEGLRGCVSIRSESEVLEYLRFFSSFETVYLFKQKDLEIYNAKGEKCFAVCLPSARWNALNLSEPLITKSGDSFEVTRYMISSMPGQAGVSLFRTTQKVEPEGNVTEMKREPLQIPAEDLLRLFFPHFL
jgi:hypothetical protein